MSFLKEALAAFHSQNELAAVVTKYTPEETVYNMADSDSLQVVLRKKHYGFLHALNMSQAERDKKEAEYAKICEAKHRDHARAAHTIKSFRETLEQLLIEAIKQKNVEAFSVLVPHRENRATVADSDAFWQTCLEILCANATLPIIDRVLACRGLDFPINFSACRSSENLWLSLKHIARTHPQAFSLSMLNRLIENNQLETVRLILSNRERCEQLAATINWAAGPSPMHHAVAMGSVEFVTLLCSYGLNNLYVIDGARKTVTDLAVAQDATMLHALLLQQPGEPAIETNHLVKLYDYFIKMGSATDPVLKQQLDDFISMIRAILYTQAYSPAVITSPASGFFSFFQQPKANLAQYDAIRTMLLPVLSNTATVTTNLRSTLLPLIRQIKQGNQNRHAGKNTKNIASYLTQLPEFNNEALLTTFIDGRPVAPDYTFSQATSPSQAPPRYATNVAGDVGEPPPPYATLPAAAAQHAAATAAASADDDTRAAYAAAP